MSGRSTAGSSELAMMGAIFVISLGVTAIFLSIATGLNPTLLSGRVLVACGFAYLIYAFAAWDDGEAEWRLVFFTRTPGKERHGRDGSHYAD